MSEVTTGLRRALSSPLLYQLFQNLMGARQGWQNFVREFVKPSVGANILDIGCGTGELLSYMPDVEYWGFDISEKYILHASNKYGSRGRFACKFLTIKDLESMPKFDVVVVSGVLHHVDDEVARNLIALAHAALKQGGRFVSVDPCWAAQQHPVARFLISRDRGRNVRTASEYEQLVSPFFFDKKVIVRHKAWVPYTQCFMECTCR